MTTASLVPARFGAACRLLLVALAATVCAQARAEAACTVTVGGGVSFGRYDVFSPVATDSAGTILYQCTKKEKNVRITMTTGTSGTLTKRTLVNGREALAYNLFLDAAHTIVWGDDTQGSQAYYDPNPFDNRPITISVFGRIPQGQDVAPGTYADTVTVVINF
jgi:spore coat protein U-like protein